MEHYTDLKKWAEATLDQITGKDRKEDIEQIEKVILKRTRPRTFAGKDGLEVRHIKGFEETCILLNQHIPTNPKTMTALAFYQALEVVKEQNERRKKANRRV